MFISRHIFTSYGPALASAPLPVVIPANPEDALAFARRVDRQADAELQAGHIHHAERLSHLALEARCRATGARS